MNLDLYPIDDLLLRRRKLRKELHSRQGLQPVRIAVLGGSTTSELVDLWELLLLASGFQPAFYQSDYGRFYEDAVVAPQALIDFHPDLVYLHTSWRNIEAFPPLQSDEAAVQHGIDAVLRRYRQIWQSLWRNLSCQVIQNNFELPPQALLGNMEMAAPGARSLFLMRLNLAFAAEAAHEPRLLLQDVHGLSARMGLDRWFDPERWFRYKIPVSSEASLILARSLTAMVRSIYGRRRKVLVLDLDNTLWGGVIGDDGLDGIILGRETPLAEAYTAFQEYCLALRSTGVLLAVCSKNDEQTALQGFQHPDSVLRREHFAAFKANWEPKHENLLAIARDLNLGVDSFVFLDDNPAERAIVVAQLPAVAVPEAGSDVTGFAAAIEAGRYFEPVSLSHEDLERASIYAGNAQRAAAEAQFTNYGEYLDSLEMSAEIDAFRPLYLERIAQLTNKTNQFNLTTRRYTLAEMEAISHDPRYIGLYGRLEDRFGDNGLVSVVLGRGEQDGLHLDLWLMSCRVLKREMEEAMLDALVERAQAAGLERLYGYYRPTAKNGMVAGHYQNMGFTFVSSDASTGETVWSLDLNAYHPHNRHIRTKEPAVHG